MSTGIPTWDPSVDRAIPPPPGWSPSVAEGQAPIPTWNLETDKDIPAPPGWQDKTTPAAAPAAEAQLAPDPLDVQVARSVIDRYRSQAEPLGAGYSSFLMGAETVLKRHAAQSPDDDDIVRLAWASSQLDKWTKPTPLPPEMLQATRELERSMGRKPGSLSGPAPGIPREQLGRQGEQPRDFTEALMGVQTEEGTPPFLQETAGDWLGERTPFLGSIKEASDLTSVVRALKRLKATESSPEKTNPVDYWIVANYLKTASDEEKRGFWSQVGNMATQMPAFMVEFATTFGAFSGAKKAAEIAAVRATKGVVSGAVRKTTVKTIGAAAGVAAHTAANPQLVAESTARQMLPEMQFSADEQGRLQKLIIGDSKGLAEVLGKGFLDAYIELGSEQMGGLVGKVPWAKIPVANKIVGLKAAIVRRLIGRGKTVSQIEDLLKAGGWHGPVGEMFEERVGDVGRGLTGVSEDYGTTGGLVAGDPEAWEQLAVEAVAFSIPALTQAVARVAELKAIRAKGYVAATDEIPGNTRKERMENLRQEEQQLEQEIQNASTVRGDETEVRKEEGRADLRRRREEQVPTEPPGEGAAPRKEEVQVEEAAPEPTQPVPTQPGTEPGVAGRPAEAPPRDEWIAQRVKAKGVSLKPRSVKGRAKLRKAQREAREAYDRQWPYEEEVPVSPETTKLQRAAEAATQEAMDDLDAFGTMLRRKGLGMNVPFDPEVIAGAAQLTAKFAKAGTLKFAAFLEQVATTIGQVAADRIRPMLESEWEKVRKTGEVPGMEEITPPIPPGAETTGTKNVRTDEMRPRTGLGGRVYGEKEAVEEWQGQAQRRIADDPTYAHRLADELASTPRAIDKIEDAVLNQHIRALENRRRAGEDVRDEMLTAVEASEKSGAEWGRSGVSRQAELNADFSLAGITRQHMQAVGEPPSPEQMAEYEEMADEIVKLEAERDDLRAKLAQKEVERSISQAQKQPSQPRPKKGTKKERLQQKASGAVADFKEKWGSLFQAGVVYDPRREADKWVQVVKAAGKVVRAYAELGVNSFTELLANVTKDMGTVGDNQRAAFREAWDEHKGQMEPALPENAGKPAIGVLARKLMRRAVEAGVEGRDAVVDAVHDELAEVLPDITRYDTMEAMSGYGDYRELPKDKVNVTIRGYRGELQQLLKLEDMQAGRAPRKTGVERREPTEEERQLIKEVNEAKTRAGYVVTDPARQLKSALNTARTSLNHRITDQDLAITELEEAIAKRTPITPKERKELEPDAELASLREQLAKRRERRKELQDEYNKIFPPTKPVISEARRLKMAEALLERQIAQMEEDLATGRLGPRAKPTPLTSPELEAKRQELAKLREAREEARRASPEYQAEEEARQTARYKKTLERQLAFWEQRRHEAGRGELPTKTRKPTPEDKEILEKKAEISAVKREAIAEINKIKRMQRPGIQKVAEVIPEALNTSRAILTSFDLSAVLRQGGVLSAAHPMLSKKAFVPMLRALASEHGQAVAIETIKDLPSADLAQKAGLEITTDEASMAAMEEAYMSRLAGKIPGVSHSQRAYMTFLNVQRAMVFNSLVAKLGRKGEVTLDEARVLANWVNVASGRGTLGRAQAAATTLATVFFAPRYVVSRFQLLLGQPLWTGLLKGQGGGRARRLVAQEYSRMASGLALFYGTFALMAAMLWGPDDEDKPTVSFDPRSADFGKLRFGETRIDPLSGHAQAITLLGRLAFGETVSARGEVRPLLGDKRKYGGLTVAGVLGRFVRSKLSPGLGTAIDIRAGENVVGEKVSLASGLVGLGTPLVVEDVYEAMLAQGVPKGSAMGILAILGMSSQTYGDYTTYKQAKPKDRKKLFERFLENMEWDYGFPAYADMLTADQIEEVRKAQEHSWQKVVYGGSEAPPKYKQGQAIADWKKAKERYAERHPKALEKWQEFAPLHAPTYEDAVELLRDYFYNPKSKKGGIYDKSTADPYDLKDTYSSRLGELRTMYGK